MDDTPVAQATPRAETDERADPSKAARLVVIAAVARNGIIGAGNKMPWHIPGDLRHFRALTTGHRVVMGRRTWESVGRPLPGRENVIVSRDRSLIVPGCIVVNSLAAALVGSSLPLPVFCIGGAKLYDEALRCADRLCLTEIDAEFDGDTRMPTIDLAEWRECSRVSEIDPASGLHYAFVEFARVGKGA